MTASRTIRTLAASVALAFAFAGPAAATSVTDPDYPRSLDAEGPVAVSWEDPSGFTEIRFSRNRFEAVRGDWVRELARHVATRAGRALMPGERLEVRITDIKRAGEYEPGRGVFDHVRVVRDIYPPLVQLQFTRFDAQGNAVDSGDRTLTDIGFLARTVNSPNGGDPLRHEKRLINDWVGRDLARGPAVANGD